MNLESPLSLPVSSKDSVTHFSGGAKTRGFRHLSKAAAFLRGLVLLVAVLLCAVPDSLFATPDTFSNTGSLSAARYSQASILLQNGKVLAIGGTGSGQLGSCELYDPSTGTWTATGGLSVARESFSATLLPNGKVLVVGGLLSGSNPSVSAELYDPVTGVWIQTGSLSVSRYCHVAVLLPNGKVLVAGGSGGAGLIRSTAEIYDPATGVWTATGSLSAPRYAPAALLLLDGKVLISGGEDNSGGWNASAELYNPNTAVWTVTGSMSTQRSAHSMTMLPNGKVLVAGGYNSGSGPLSSGELFDPGAGTWSSAGSFSGGGRSGHMATLLPSGKLLISGGIYIAETELYDPNTNSWSSAGGLNQVRRAHSATLLPSGLVLISGGYDGTSSLTSCELYDSATPTWSATGALAAAREYATVTTLANGKVLIAGGDVIGTPVNSCELYDPATGLSVSTGSLSSTRKWHSAILLPNGKVLVAGGNNGSTVASCELYDPAAGLWTATGSLAVARRSVGTLVLLPNGTVLAAGGNDGSNALNSVEAYDPASGVWTTRAGMNQARFLPSQTLLPSGKVLVAGGHGPSVDYSESEIYDPVANTWTWTSGSMSQPRGHHTATLLPNGKVLVTGGLQGFGPVNTPELFDPASGTWSSGGSSAVGRWEHNTLLLPNGKVLVLGGTDGTNVQTSVELYDPASNSWSTLPSLLTGRLSFASTLLPNGNVFVAGGNNGSTAISSCELFDPGLGFSPAWQPQITTANFSVGNKLVLTGTLFTGTSNASNGNYQDSASNFPVVQLRSLANEQTLFLTPDPTAGWSPTSFTSKPIVGFPNGPAFVTVFANGIPSDSKIVFVGFSVSNVTVAQQNGTNLVDVFYDLTGNGSTQVGLSVSVDGGSSFSIPVTSVAGDIGGAITGGTHKHITWNAGVDWPGQMTSQLQVRVSVWDRIGAGGSFAPIAGGTYQMGNLIGDGDITDAGTVSVTLSPYFISINDTTKAQWDTVRTWAANNFYSFSAGAGYGSIYPLSGANWYDVVKWANAASEMDGLTPCYKVSGAVYRTGNSDSVVCDWSANGYRLPTEAEWEIAARGGLSGKRFAWGDTISQSQANYTSGNYSYDLSGPSIQNHPVYGSVSGTSPVGSFAPNGYGLYDMGGNVWQWCWDWYGSYAGGSNPAGGASGTNHVIRGGDFGGSDGYATNARCANRGQFAPSSGSTDLGFRLARSANTASGSGAVSSAGSLVTSGPTVTTQPAAYTTLTVSGALNLSVTATGQGTLSYQWKKNGSNIGVPTGPTFTIGSVVSGDAGTYTCQITDGANGVSVTSAPAIVSVVVPSVTNVSFAQQNGTGIVDISYDLATSGPVGLLVSFDGGLTFQSVNSLTGAVGSSVSAGNGKHIFWDAVTDWPNSNISNLVVRVTPLLAGLGETFAPIPSGTYQMGNYVASDSAGDGDITDANPVTVSLSPYHMATNATTKDLWDTVRTWGLSNGYTDLPLGDGKASGHPVQNVSWLDAVKWANAASELEGLTPCYTVAGFVYRTGSGSPVVCDWNANGYRLPTEAEWEIAARGGLSGKRFPWGDTISQSLANYYGNTNLSYDIGPNGTNSIGAVGGSPYTSPVGSFAANGYGLYDMAGNVFQWCWDLGGSAYAGGNDPRGPVSGSDRVVRGGNWYDPAQYARCAMRYSDPENYVYSNQGFRLARGVSAGINVGVASASGPLNTNVPTIATQPQGGSVVTGGSFTLNVVTGRAGTFGYQWYLNGGSIASGGTSSSYIITNAGSANTGTYTVVVSNIAGSLTSSPAVVIAGAGALDTAMGGDGTFSASWGGWDDIARSVVVQPDGKFIVFGDAFNASTYDFVVARYNPDGSADSSFNGNGRVWFDSGANDWASKVLLQPDGKIVLVGYSNVVSNYSFYVVRLNSDGTLDSTFNGTGSVRVDISGDDYAQSAVLQPDGKILVGGYTGNANAPHTVIRLNADGSLDSLFGAAGVAQLTIGSDHRSTGTLVQADGKVVLTGSTNLGGAWNFSAVRFNADGTLDGAFNSSGAQYTAIGSSAIANGGVLQPDGKIVIAGTATISGQSKVALVRYTSTGALDGTFGSGGVVTTAIGSFNADVYAIALEGDGKLLVTGGADGQILTIRYNSNGTLDGSFGVGGVVLTPFGLTATGLAVAQTNEGRIVVVGEVNTNEADYDFAVVQFDAGTFAPFIRAQPVGGTLLAGGSMSLNVGVIGTPPISYLWYLNGGSIATGGTSSSYPIVSAGTANTGSYSVTVSNAYGAVSSGTVAVTVISQPAILTQPTGGSIASGGSFTMSVVASGGGTLAYQWYFNGGSITSGGTSSSYSVVKAGSLNAGSYNVVVNNSAGSVTSDTVFWTVATDMTPPALSGLAPVSVQATKPEGAVVTYPAAIATDDTTPSPVITYSHPSGSNFPVGVTTVTVTATDAAGNSVNGTFTVTVTLMPGVAPAITSHPTGGLLLPGQSLSLSVVASGTETLTYQWYLDSVSIPGANTGIYVATTPGIYRVVVANAYGSIPSGDAVVTLAAAPTVVVQPGAAPMISGGSVTYAANASGTGPFTYQWRLGTTPISGANGATFTITSSHLGDVGLYTCVITGPGGSVTTEPFESPLRITTQPQAQLFALGGSLNLSVGAVGAGSLTYQWYKDASPLPGETNATYSKAVAVTEDKGLYSVVVGYNGLQLSSEVVSVSQGTPEIVMTPEDRVVVLNGGSVTLSVSVLNEPLLTQKA
ncbi:MAG: SUMF1/EgtB/PvdO family nonheme iron enzyme, partial [Verrucomicrobiota bacterium]